ncbi:MAG TPA: hypothetical protein VF765_24015 [Polyangiaceae bacterium]
MRPQSMSVLVLIVGATLAACGLSTEGDAPPTSDGGGEADTGPAGQPDANGGGQNDAMTEAGGGGDAPASADAPTKDVASDAPGQPDVPVLPDAPAGDGWTCVPVAADGGLLGKLDLSTFTTAGTASWDENGDGKMTLTNSNNFEAGAAWFTTPWPVLQAYSLTWSFRVGPGDTAGDGITFAVLQTTNQPDNNFVGDTGDGLGLRNLQGTGYAVAIDMYNTNEIRLVTMPSYTTVIANHNGDMLNDGNVYTVDVSWHAPSTLSATLHSKSGPLTVTSIDPGFATTDYAWIGFTGATGGGSDSHNEVGGITVNSACQ